MMQASGMVAGIAGLALLAGCGTTELFGTYDLPEDPATAEAPWPRLVDTPTPPPPGSYGPGIPDPATGDAVIADLQAEAAASGARAGAVGQPVLSEGDRRRLGK